MDKPWAGNPKAAKNKNFFHTTKFFLLHGQTDDS